MKKDEKIHLPVRTSEITNWKYNCSKENKIQFHQDRAPGNQKTGRNLRLQPRKNHLVHTSLKN